MTLLGCRETYTYTKILVFVLKTDVAFITKSRKISRHNSDIQSSVIELNGISDDKVSTIIPTSSIGLVWSKILDTIKRLSTAIMIKGQGNAQCDHSGNEVPPYI